MLKVFHEHLIRTGLITEGQRVIVACSGGPDSMALADLLRRFNLEVHLAHMNYGLRGADSDADEQLVRDYAAMHELPVHVHHESAAKAADARKGGIQEAARTLRYNWFDELSNELSADAVATAHHQDDQVETHLWHLLRGSSWSGFTGIPSQIGNIVRPLLFARKAELISYCESEGVPYRTDSSNASADYSRNRIRHELIPLLDSIRPGFQKNILRQIDNFNDLDYIATQFLSSLTPEVIELSNEGLRLDVSELRKLPFQRLLLLRVARDYGFPARRVDELLSLIGAEPGKTVYSQTHRVIRERDALVITTRADAPMPPAEIEAGQEEVHAPLHLVIDYGSPHEIPLTDHPLTAFFDFDKLDFPLTIRPWQHGDRMRPLGLAGSQKLSDIYTQEKWSTLDKESAYVLCSGDKIIWAIKSKVAEFTRVTPETRKVMRFRLMED